MTPMLSFENINVAIADAPVLRNVSFSLQPGVSAALIGRNGAGKTTTVRTIMGFTKANGTVRLGGEDLGPDPAAPPAIAGSRLCARGPPAVFRFHGGGEHPASRPRREAES